MIGSTDNNAEARLLESLKEAGCFGLEFDRLDTETKLKERLLEMQAIYDSKKALRDEAYKTYNDNKLTMRGIAGGASFSHRTLYHDPILKRYAEFLVRKSNESDPVRKMEQAISDKQKVERYNEALVRDVIELLHYKEDYGRLVEQTTVQLQQIKELEAQLGGRSNVLPMERRVVTKPNNLEGVFPVDLHRD